MLLSGIWLAGTGLALTFLLIGLVRLAWFASRSTIVRDGRWHDVMRDITRDYRLPYQGPDSVSVFDDAGRFAAVLRLPDGITPTDAGSTYLLGKSISEDGTTQIRLYAVRWIE